MLRTNHRNILLCLVPSMYTVSRDDERDFFYEQFSKVTLLGKKQYQSEPIVELTTIPRRKRAMQHVMAYTIPRVYSSTLSVSIYFHLSTRKTNCSINIA